MLTKLERDLKTWFFKSRKFSNHTWIFGDDFHLTDMFHKQEILVILILII